MAPSSDAQVTITTDGLGRPEKLVLRAAGLRVVAGGEHGAVHEIASSPILIGSHRSCHVRLDDPTVSARHAEVVLRPAGYLARDLGSRNGITVGGWRVEQIYLSPGMVLGIGRAALEVVDLEREMELPLSSADSFGRLVGRSLAMRQVFATLEAAARSDATVLLEGETGTGKEVMAESLHLASRRASAPFVVFDCSAVPVGLVESELFGHVRGAFTGAAADRDGALQRADGGTLFLDEIGELALEIQPKLLRALETRRFVPVGSHATRSVDVRIVAATHRNLDHELERGGFRKDLYYRLAVLRIHVPPLRERLDDLPLLVERIALALGQEEELDRLLGLMPLLRSYGWPGNVRELRNVVERLGVLSPDAALPSVLRGPRRQAAAFSEAREHALEQFERRYVAELLAQTDGNVTRAAELAGVSRRYLTRLIARHGLRRQE